MENKGLYEYLSPITLLETHIKNQNNVDIVTFDNIKTELTAKIIGHDGEEIDKYDIGIKETDDLALLYYKNNKLENTMMINNYDNIVDKINHYCKSLIIEKETLNVICSQYNKIIYNNPAKAILKNNFTKSDYCFNVQESYEGTLLLVFNHNNKWFVSTRRCLDANDSKWIKNKSYGELFEEVINGKFTFNDLNSNYCYHFVLVHHDNVNLIKYENWGENYKELIHIRTTEKFTLTPVTFIVPNTIKPKMLKFKKLADINKYLSSLNEKDEKNKSITTEGLIINMYEQSHPESITVMKLQTYIYNKIYNIKPNNYNIDQIYLELYQKDKLYNFVPYLVKGDVSHIINRINSALKNISSEITTLYHETRNKKNKELYDIVPKFHRQILYELHGIYLKKINNEEQKKEATINVHNVYEYLKKNTSSYVLRELFFERSKLIENYKNDKLISFINISCPHTNLQTAMMQQ